MSKAFSNLLKHIDKLSHTDKERVFQWVKRYVEPSSTVDGRLIDEMEKCALKKVLNALIALQNILIVSVK